MNIVVVNETGIEVFKSWSQVKKYTSFDKQDFTEVGKNDFILNCDNESYEIAKDIKLLERVASERVFTKNGMDLPTVMVCISAVMTLLIFMKL